VFAPRESGFEGKVRQAQTLGEVPPPNHRSSDQRAQWHRTVKADDADGELDSIASVVFCAFRRTHPLFLSSIQAGCPQTDAEDAEKLAGGKEPWDRRIAGRSMVPRGFCVTNGPVHGPMRVNPER
jgi:hypothetical protein